MLASCSGIKHAYNACWDSRTERASRQLRPHDCVRAHDDAVADASAAHDSRLRAYPDILADHHGFDTHLAGRGWHTDQMVVVTYRNEFREVRALSDLDAGAGGEGGVVADETTWANEDLRVAVHRDRGLVVDFRACTEQEARPWIEKKPATATDTSPLADLDAGVHERPATGPSEHQDCTQTPGHAVRVHAPASAPAGAGSPPGHRVRASFSSGGTRSF